MPSSSPGNTCFDQWIIKKLIFELKGQNERAYVCKNKTGPLHKSHYSDSAKYPSYHIPKFTFNVHFHIKNHDIKH